MQTKKINLPKLKRNLAVVILLAAFAGVFAVAAPTARADSIITNCSNDSQLTSALASGGIITFNCGAATIPFNGQKTITADVTIDGGGKIILSGANATRLFWVNSGKALTLRNIVLNNGSAGANYGGCIYVDGGILNISNSTIQNCKTNNYAGGAIVSPLGHLLISGSVFKNNSASSGGAISATGNVTIYASQFLNNTATNVGGALSLAATVDIYTSTFSDNKVTGADSQGGAIYANGTVGVHQSIFSANQAAIGGAIYVEQASTLVLNARGTLTGNTATSGGAVYNAGTATIETTTLSKNTGGAGSGLSNTGTASLTNVTFSGNSSQVSYGAAIYSAGPLTLVNDTLYGNSAPGYGGIYYDGGGISIKNTLIAKGASGANCNGNFGGTLNLSDDLSCNFGTGRDGVALLLNPLSYNGMAVQTHLPKPGSPAIDGGTSAGAPATDERGYARSQGNDIDVGAVEVCTLKPDKPNLVSPSNNGKYQGTQVVLRWTYALCSDKYKITIKDATTGAKVQSGKSDTYTFKTTALVKGKSYLWYVQACNTVGCTKSDTWKFTVK